MQSNNRVKTVLGQAMTYAIPGLVLGILLLVIPVNLLLNLLCILLGAVTVIYSIPELVAGFISITTTEGKFVLLSSLISLCIGLVLIFYHGTILMLILGVCLLGLPLISVVLSKDRMTQLRAELPRMILGVILLLIGPGRALELLLRVAGVIVLVLTVLYVFFVFWRVHKMQHVTGNRVFVDTDGNGKVDTVYVDTNGNGRPDTATRYKEDQ